MPSPIVVWFRNDLRLADNKALAAAAARGPVVGVYVFDDRSPGKWRMGGASRWWLHWSLESLARALAERGGSLVLRRGPPDEVLLKLAGEVCAKGVYCTRSYEPWALRAETSVARRAASSGLEFACFDGALLHDPERLATKSGGPFKVFTPFWRALSKARMPEKPLPAPEHIEWSRTRLLSDELSDWRLRPSRPNWAKGFEQCWQPGEGGARKRLADFLDGELSRYDMERDRPDFAVTSRISPHLHFGELSPAQCWYAATLEGASAGNSRETFLRELAWRDFSYHLLFHVPDLPEKPFRCEFAEFPWRDDTKALRAWQRGETGYPIVDAGMRQLWETGWMHNRVRMIVASFLIKDLLISWQEGEAWFWDTLVDADLANNAASWQWVAGCGADAAPYFRIFNPLLQARKFDPHGDYVRRWVPELGRLAGASIHAPSELAEDVLARAGITLGVTYPHPIVDHGQARERALAAFEWVKKYASRR